MSVYGLQQNNDDIRNHIDMWNSLHANVTDDKGMIEYNKERIKKHKIRLIEFFRKSQIKA